MKIEQFLVGVLVASPYVWVSISMLSGQPRPLDRIRLWLGIITGFSAGIILYWGWRW